MQLLRKQHVRSFRVRRNVRHHDNRENHIWHQKYNLHAPDGRNMRYFHNHGNAGRCFVPLTKSEFRSFFPQIHRRGFLQDLLLYAQRLWPGLRRSRNFWISSSERESPAGQPSMTAPRAFPWDSPHVVTVKCEPKLDLFISIESSLINCS